MTDADKLDIITRAGELIADGIAVEVAAQSVGVTGKTLRQWAIRDPACGEVYQRARQVSAGALEDEAIEIARTSTNDTYGPDRLKVDTLKWAAAKRYPREYGDLKQEHTHTINVGTLHLDALRAPQITATARITANSSADNGLDEGDE